MVPSISMPIKNSVLCVGATCDDDVQRSLPVVFVHCNTVAPCCCINANVIRLWANSCSIFNDFVTKDGLRFPLICV